MYKVQRRLGKRSGGEARLECAREAVQGAEGHEVVALLARERATVHEEGEEERAVERLLHPRLIEG
eukprot:14508932-Heterocapsa_arctica.AAC.1